MSFFVVFLSATSLSSILILCRFFVLFFSENIARRRVGGSGISSSFHHAPGICSPDILNDVTEIKKSVFLILSSSKLNYKTRCFKTWNKENWAANYLSDNGSQICMYNHSSNNKCVCAPQLGSMWDKQK